MSTPTSGDEEIAVARLEICTPMTLHIKLGKATKYRIDPN
jgi:hypothetical protein